MYSHNNDLSNRASGRKRNLALHETLANSHPSLAHRQVWCRVMVLLDGRAVGPSEQVWLADAIGAAPMARVGKHDAGRELDGRTWDEMPPLGRCRECGCTDLDCSEYVERTGEPCYWVEDDLCSACTPEFA